MNLHRRLTEHDIVREQLHRIVTSKEFARSERSCHLLRFLVDHALGESVPALKEYVVGVEVFGKSADFDTRSSSIVRVEATRLRKKLRTYYRSAGTQDPVIISLPQGGYHARLEMRQTPGHGRSSSSPTTRAEENVKSLAILPPAYSAVPLEEVKALTDAIWRSLHLAGGIDMLPPPLLSPGKAGRQRRRRRDSADFVMELTVRPPGGGERLQVSARIAAPAGDTIWCATYQSVSDLVRCGCRIGHEVLGCLQASPPPNRWYELGRHLLQQLTPTSLWNSRICLEQAALAEGSDPRVLSSLAIACAWLYAFDGGNPETLVERIRETAPRGMGSECGADGYLALAVAAWGYDRDADEAERLLAIARNVRPQAGAVRYCRALFLASEGRNDEAAEELVDTHNCSAFSVDAELALGCGFWLRREYGKAAARVRYAISAEPKNAIAHLLLGWILLADSRPHEAVEVLETAQALFGAGSPATGALGYAAARAGRTGTARDVLEGLRCGVDERYQVDADAGIVHLGLGEEREACRCFQAARERRAGRLGILHFTPEFDAVRSMWLSAQPAKSRSGAA